MMIKVLFNLLFCFATVIVCGQDIDSLNRPTFMYQGANIDLKEKSISEFLSRQMSKKDIDKIEAENFYVAMAIIKFRLDEQGNVQDIEPIVSTSVALSSVAVLCVKRTSGHWKLQQASRTVPKNPPIFIPFLHIHDGATYEDEKRKFLQNYLESGKYLQGWIKQYYDEQFIHYDPIVTVSYPSTH